MKLVQLPLLNVYPFTLRLTDFLFAKANENHQIPVKVSSNIYFIGGISFVIFGETKTCPNLSYMRNKTASCYRLQLSHSATKDIYRKIQFFNPLSTRDETR